VISLREPTRLLQRAQSARFRWGVRAPALAGVLPHHGLDGWWPACAPIVHCSAGDHRADLDFVVIFYHLAVGQELVATDHHCGAREDAELGEQAAHGATPDDLDRAPLGVQMDPHARLLA